MVYNVGPEVILTDTHRRGTVIASHLPAPIVLNAAHPAAEWQSAQPIRFSCDWQGNNPDPELETEVCVLWSPEMLHLRFVCRYRELFVFEDSDPNGRRDHLWDRDVAEVFLQPPTSAGHVGAGEDTGGPFVKRSARLYKEFEVAPNGMWIDLDIAPSGLADLKSGLTRSVHVDPTRKIWAAELAIPMESLGKSLDPGERWRVNFFRVEGKTEPRRYMAWQPTHTPQPNFHVPEKFGTLVFEE